MPSADKQKKQKVPSRKARGQMTRAAYRGATHSNIAFERYMKPAGRTGLFLARVLKASGNGRFQVLNLEDGGEYNPQISGDLKLPGRAARNPMVRTAITPGDYVLTDGSRIDAVLTSQQAGQARKKIGKASRSRSRSANSLFSHGSFRNGSLEAKLEARKEAHKHGPATRKSNSRSGSRSASKSSRSRSSHASSGSRRSGSKGSKGSRASSRKMGQARRAPNMASRRSRAKYGLAAFAASATANAAANTAANRELEKEAEAEAYFAKRAVPKAWNK
jgi:hypothetical protein